MSEASQADRPIVRAEGLTKSYHHKAVVDDVGFEVHAGEIFGVLGTNGAGKTTTVECVQGLRRPDRGRLEVCGLDPQKDRRRLAGRIGAQLQDSALPDRLRVEEAIALFAGPRAASIDDTLATWGLADQGRQAFGALSGGQRQKLFVALALLNRPEVVFLDELTQGLDPHARLVVWDLIARLRDEGTTVVLVTHFLDEAEMLCDRLLVMRDGQVVARGSPAGLVDEHADAALVSFTPPAGFDPTSTFARLPGLRSMDFDGRTVVLRGDRELIAHAGAALVAAGPVPGDLSVQQPSLEQALLPILGGDR